VLIKQISCGEEHSAFITADGLIYSIGNNADGRLGVGDRGVTYSTSPCLVEVDTRIPASMVSCGGGHTAVVFEDGSMYSWGLGEDGALGLGPTATQWSPVKVPLNPTTRANYIS
jgi:alpha-tubulin suppressor-like RCC1 family protein